MQYAHARTCRDPAQRRRPRDRRCRPADFDPALLAHEKEGELLRALAEFPRVVARPPSCASRTGSPATSRTPPRSSTASTTDCRVLPMGDEEPTDLHRARLVLVEATRTVLANGLGLLGVSAPERM